jgi:hypothetical protein
MWRSRPPYPWNGYTARASSATRSGRVGSGTDQSLAPEFEPGA